MSASPEWEEYDLEIPEELPLSFRNDPIQRYLSFGLPGIGMFSEAYIVFSVGNIKNFQTTAYPDCYRNIKPGHPELDPVCPDILTHQKVDSYIQIIGIIVSRQHALLFLPAHVFSFAL